MPVLPAVVALGLMSVAPPGALEPGYEPARVVCDSYRRCWDEPDYRYDGRRRYDRYDRYERYDRPQSKWERKGFCPPGQRKKGNC